MSILGLKVQLARAADRDRPCCRNICIIEAGREPYAGKLRCVDCNRARGWLSKVTADWIEQVAACFGAPTTPIIVRRAHLFQEGEAPHQNT
jgi:hypothetical protein